MYFYLPILLTPILLTLCFYAGKSSIKYHHVTLEQLRSSLSESLDFEENPIKQKYVKQINNLFKEYKEN